MGTSRLEPVIFETCVRGCLAAGVLTAVMLPAAASAALVHADPFPGGYSVQRSLPVHYAFMTSWDGIEWTEQQKSVARTAIAHLGAQFLFSVPFVEITGGTSAGTGSEDGPPAPKVPAFTLRWAGGDFFRDWPATDPEFFEGTGEQERKKFDFSDHFALTYKGDSESPPRVPWPHAHYPINEIYFNTGEVWGFNPFFVDEFKLDFWTVLMHEVVHMMSVEQHSDNPDDLMYREIEYGQRKWPRAGDRALLRNAGYAMIPLPASGMLLLSVLALGVAAGTLRRRRNA